MPLMLSCLPPRIPISSKLVLKAVSQPDLLGQVIRGGGTNGSGIYIEDTVLIQH